MRLSFDSDALVAFCRRYHIRRPSHDRVRLRHPADAHKLMELAGRSSSDLFATRAETLTMAYRERARKSGLLNPGRVVRSDGQCLALVLPYKAEAWGDQGNTTRRPTIRPTCFGRTPS
jgi:hypothetical protein